MSHTDVRGDESPPTAPTGFVDTFEYNSPAQSIQGIRRMLHESQALLDEDALFRKSARPGDIVITVDCAFLSGQVRSVT
jgi:hypothetical protein